MDRREKSNTVMKELTDTGEEYGTRKDNSKKRKKLNGDNDASAAERTSLMDM